MNIDMRLKIIIVIVILCSVIGGCFSIWDSHNTEIKAKLEHQEKYPYSCIVQDNLWDECATKTEFGWRFRDNRTCDSIYYSSVNWDNHHISTVDSDGILHYKGAGYDSYGVYHESHYYFECP